MLDYAIYIGSTVGLRCVSWIAFGMRRYNYHHFALINFWKMNRTSTDELHLKVNSYHPFIIIFIHPWHFKQHRICHPVLGSLWVAWRILHIWCSWWTQTFPTLWVTLKRCWKQHVQVRLSSMSGAVIYPPCRWRFLSVQFRFPECNRFFCVEHFVIYWDEFIKFEFGYTRTIAFWLEGSIQMLSFV